MADDYSDSLATTGRVIVDGTESTGIIEVANDSDWFAVTLNAGTLYQLRATRGLTDGLTDPYLDFYDSQGHWIVSNDDGGGERNSLIAYTPLAAGDYYMAVRHYDTGTGNYTVSATSMSVSSATDDFAATTATLGRVAVGGAAITGSIQTVGDQDWFAVTLSARTSYQFRATRTNNSAGLADPYLTLLDSSGNAVTSDDDGGGHYNSLISYTPTAAGTYYLAVRDYGSGLGRYTIAAAVPDDYTATATTAGRVAVNAPEATSGNIERGGDRDWFAVRLTAGVAYQLRAEHDANNGLADPFLTLYGRAGAAIVSNNDGGGDTNALIRYTPTVTGTYYLGVRGNTSTDRGSYTVSATTADDYTASSSTTGQVATDGTVTAGTIERGGDQDWFAITLTGGTTYSLQLERSDSGGLTDPYLSLFDGQGVWISDNDDGGGEGNSLMSVTPIASGTYYLGVRDYGFGTGRYQLSATANTAVSTGGEEDDFDGTIATTGVVSVESEAGTSGVIETAWDSDLFSVALTAGVTYQLRATSAETDALEDPYLTLYDAAGTTILSNDDGGTGRNSLIVFTPETTGTFYLGVKDYDEGTGAYTVSAMTGDDFPNTAATTGEVLVNGSGTVGRIEQAADRDRFAVRLTAGTAYQFRATAASVDGLDDPYLSLLSSSGSVLASNNDAGGSLNSRISYTPTESGTYYLQVRDDANGTGAYTVSASSADDFTATVATTGVAVLNGSTSGSIESANDRDWFRAALVAGHTYTIDLQGEPSSHGTLTDPYFYGIHNSRGQLVRNTSNDDYNSTSESHTVFTPRTSGNYYFVAGAYGTLTGSYQLRVSDTQASDVASTVSTTATLAVDGRVNGRINTARDVDWFRVSLTAGQTYIVEETGDSSSTSPLPDPYFRGIYNASGRLISGTSNDNYALGSGSRVQFTPTTTGTYYLAAGAQSTDTGDYQLSLTTRINSADAIDDSITTTGTIDIGTTGVDGQVDSAFERDWYRVSLTAGQNYEINLRGASSHLGTLNDPNFVGVYDATGTLLPGTGNDDANGSTDSATTFRPTTTGTYYLAVGGYADGTGTYNLTINNSVSTEVADNINTTASMEFEYRGQIDTASDVDWIQVSLTAGRTYQIQELGSNGNHGTLSDPFLQGLYDSTGLVIPDTSNDDADGTTNSSISFTAPATGNYYIAAGGYGSETGSYRVTVTPGPPDTSGPAMVNAPPATLNPASNLTLTFNEMVRAGTGNIVLQGGGQTLTIPVTSDQVTIAGETLTVNPTNDLTNDTTYTLSIDTGAVKDLAGNDFQQSAAVSFVTSTVTHANTWTIMTYIDGDNNLEEYALGDLNEMESVTLPASVNLVSILDRTPGHDRSNGNWTDTRQGTISHDSDTETVSSFSRFTSLGEANMGSAATLTNFINWAATNNPAEHYALIIWDHGGGLDGVSWDDSNNGDNLTSNEIRSAIDNSNVDHFDLIGFDACLMGMVEQAWDLRNLTDVTVFSEELIPGTGWAYDNWLQDLANNPNLSATDVGSRIVSSYAQEYAGEEDATLSAVQSNRLGDLNNALESFATRALALDRTSSDWTRMRTAAARSASFGGDGESYNYRDLGGFMDSVATQVSDATLARTAADVSSRLDDAVSAVGGTIAGANGLSIYLPYGSTRVDSAYTATNHSFLASSSWESFLGVL
ncbi:MAG: DVUA0089 family protein [Magnetococcales bacterium]|nr:DVUA0089 family protein [Magnetococcales bacterium]